MTEYQKITLRETHEEIITGIMEYPVNRIGIIYIILIVYDEDTLSPSYFLTVQPQDILKREMYYNEDIYNEIVEGAEAARNQETDYKKAVEEEIHRRAQENIPQQPEGGDHEGLFG